MVARPKHYARSTEGIALAGIAAIAMLGFLSAAAARQIRQDLDPLPALTGAILPPLIVAAALVAFHLFLKNKKIQTEQIIWPAVNLLFVIGLIMIWRLRGMDGVSQQLFRGYIPGVMIATLFIARPQLIETIRRWAVPIGLLGLLLPFATAVFGVVDETGARLSLKIGPLPAIQTTELIKLSLIIFLAWYVERQGQAAEGRAWPLFGMLRVPSLPYFIPGVLFVAVATLALVLMSDYGAVLILAFDIYWHSICWFRNQNFYLCFSHWRIAGSYRRADFVLSLDGPHRDPVSLPGFYESLEQRNDHCQRRLYRNSYF
jgi:cell division protein FtsW (lipid II flippase)